MLYHIYCDESRLSKDRFMILGGLLIPAASISHVDEVINSCRNETNMTHELKWGRVSAGKLKDYNRFMDYFFALNNSDKVVFHSMILDTHEFDHSKFSDGDAEVGFYKFVYQLLLHSFGKNYCRSTEDSFLVRLDNRNTHYKLSTLRDCLNSEMKKRFEKSHAPFKTVEPRDSKTCNLIQLVDVLLGAIGYEKNGYVLLPNSNNSKKEMVKTICSKSGLKNLSDSTSFRQRRFTIWNFKLQPNKKRPESLRQISLVP